MVTKKNGLVGAIAGASMLGAVTANAAPISTYYKDNYIGGSPTHSSFEGEDRIGGKEFELYGANVKEFPTTGGIKIDFDMPYYKPGTLDTQLADLFLSANGFTLFGDAPYTQDNLSNTNGENEIDFVFSLKDGNIYMNFDSDPLNILRSDDLIDGDRYIYRADQPVQRKDGGVKLNSNNTNFTFTQGKGISFSFNVNDLETLYGSPIERLGVWYGGATCANDVIKFNHVFDNATTVPEPQMFGLLGIGLAGLYYSRRKAKKKE